MFPVACFKNGTNYFFPINTFSISSLYVDPKKYSLNQVETDILRVIHCFKCSYWKVTVNFINYV